MDFSGSDVEGELKLTGHPKRWGSPSIHFHYNIRQYMSYKIVECALMNRINKDCEINVPPSPSLTPSSQAMSAPQRLTPDRLPDPYGPDGLRLIEKTFFI